MDPGTFTAVSATFGGDITHVLSTAYMSVLDGLHGSAAMAGSDSTAEQWSASYDDATRHVTAGSEDVINGCYQLAALLEANGFNHALANDASTPGATVPTRDTANYTGESISLPAPPSAYGGSTQPVDRLDTDRPPTRRPPLAQRPPRQTPPAGEARMPRQWIGNSNYGPGHRHYGDHAMRMPSERLISSTIEAIDDFVAGRSDQYEVQAKLQTVMPLIERETPNLYNVIRVAESELELIAFTKIRASQRPAADQCLRDLRSKLIDALSSSHDCVHTGRVRGTCRQAHFDLQDLLVSTMTEDEIDNLWGEQWYASYDPRYNGLSYREWFAHVLRKLQFSSSAELGA